MAGVAAMLWSLWLQKRLWREGHVLDLLVPVLAYAVLAGFWAWNMGLRTGYWQ